MPLPVLQSHTPGRRPRTPGLDWTTQAIGFKLGPVFVASGGVTIALQRVPRSNVRRPYEHRGALRGTPGSACQKPEPNATELPSCAPGRPKLIELQATKPSPTPTRAEDDIATTPDCGPAGHSGHQAFAHADTHRGTHRHDAGLWTCRPPRLRPRRHAEHLAGLQIVRLRALASWREKETVRVGLKGRARDQTCAPWCSGLPTSRLNDRK